MYSINLSYGNQHQFKLEPGELKYFISAIKSMVNIYHKAYFSPSGK